MSCTYSVSEGVRTMNHKKIAELANVSASTVSKALSGSTEISREVTERIRRIAIESGYFKEKTRRKREYNNNSSIFIAVLVPELLGMHYSEVVTRIKKEIEANGANIAIYVYDFDSVKMNRILEEIILSGVTDGVITFSEPELSVEPNIPIVCFGKDLTCKYDSVVNDVESIVHSCIEYLKGFGHKKIAFVGERYTRKTNEAFVDAMKANGLECRDDYMCLVDLRHENIGVEAAERIVQLNSKPTAIIAAYDVIALSLIHELEKRGISVPDDISVMGINNISTASYAQVPLTTVDTFSEEQFRMGVDLLFDKIIRGTSAIKHISIEYKIIERASVRKI